MRNDAKFISVGNFGGERSFRLMGHALFLCQNIIPWISNLQRNVLSLLKVMIWRILISQSLALRCIAPFPVFRHRNIISNGSQLMNCTHHVVNSLTRSIGHLKFNNSQLMCLNFIFEALLCVRQMIVSNAVYTLTNRKYQQYRPNRVVIHDLLLIFARHKLIS